MLSEQCFCVICHGFCGVPAGALLSLIILCSPRYLTCFCPTVNPPSHTARPRPPWFIATVSSITEDDPPLPSPPAKGGASGAGGGAGPGLGGTLASDERDAGDRDAGGGRKGGVIGPGGAVDDSGMNIENIVNGTPIEDLPQSTTSSTTTTTLRPPPWLITNTTKNTTTSTTTTTTTTTTSTTAKPASSSTTTTAQPQTNLESPSGAGGASEHSEGVSGDEDPTSTGDKSPESPDQEQFPTSTISTTSKFWRCRDASAHLPATHLSPVCFLCTARNASRAKECTTVLKLFLLFTVLFLQVNFFLLFLFTDHFRIVFFYLITEASEQNMVGTQNCSQTFTFFYCLISCFHVFLLFLFNDHFRILLFYLITEAIEFG